MRHVIAVALLAVPLLCGCETSCSYSTATLTEAQTARAIHPESQAPSEPTRTFFPEAPAIYAVAKLTYAPDGTRVKATFHYLEDGEREIASDEIEAEGERWVSFTLSSASTSWPTGQYEVRLYLNGEEVDRLPFNVARDTQTARSIASPQPTPSATPETPRRPSASSPPTRRETIPEKTSKTAHKKLLDDTFGLELEIPSSWSYRVTPERDYLLEAPQGSTARELRVVLQFISKAHNPGSSAVRQAEQALAQVKQAPGVEIKKQEMLEIAGQEAPYFVATYSAKKSKQESATFGHTQIVMDHGEYYYWLSYFGPADIYEENASVFEHLVETFRFTDD